MQQLISWKTNTPDKPVLLTGASGVGKTYLALDFAKNNFEQYLYVNFETDGGLRDYIAQKTREVMNDSDICAILCNYFQIPLELSNVVLLVLDNIDFCDEARIILQESDGYNIIAIASHTSVLTPSLIEDCIHIKMFPLRFDEFLMASGREWYRDIVTAHFTKMKRIPEIVHQELLDYFEEYLTVGGMPQAVNEHILLEASENVSACHQMLYNNILGRINSYYDEGSTLRQQQMLSVLEQQLAKENKKFQFNVIRRGATLQLYSRALECLKYDNNIIVVDKIGSGSSFRIYPYDVGMYSYRLDIQNNTVPDEHRKRNLLIEAFVVQELTASGHSIGFWESGARAKVDVIISIDGKMIPCDIRTDNSNRSKSVRVFAESLQPPYIYRLWDKNFELSDNKKCIPLYAAFCL